jgi:hypothetical protein
MKAIGTISLLVLSNIFMTLAWYGHLKFKDWNRVHFSGSGQQDGIHRQWRPFQPDTTQSASGGHYTVNICCFFVISV